MWQFILLGALVMLLVIICVRAGFRTIERSVKAQADGKCSGCGYDLAGLERDATCPECGMTHARDARVRIRKAAPHVIASWLATVIILTMIARGGLKSGDDLASAVAGVMSSFVVVPALLMMLFRKSGTSNSILLLICGCTAFIGASPMMYVLKHAPGTYREMAGLIPMFYAIASLAWSFIVLAVVTVVASRIAHRAHSRNES